MSLIRSVLSQYQCGTYPVLITVSHTGLIPLPEDFLSDVQTDVHFVPVDTAGDTHKLLILLMSH